MSLIKRGDVWHYDFTVKGIRYRGSTGHRSKTAARREEERQRADVVAGVPAARKVLSIREAADKWFASRAADKKSATTTALRLEIMLRHIGADTPLDAIAEPEIEEALQARRVEKTRQGRAPTNSTVNRDIIDTTLRPVLNYAGRVLKQPVASISWKDLRLAEPRGRERTFTGAEIDAWRAALPEWHRPVFDFVSRYGLRLREAFFPIDWFDPEAGRIVLRNRKNGGGQNIRLLDEDARRMAAMYGRAKAANLPTLWFREMRDGRLRAIHWRGFQSASASAGRKASIADARPVHDLRHHAATVLVRNTGNLHAVKELLGHDSIQSTMRYAHAHEDDVFNALRHTYDTKAETVAASPAPATKKIGT